MSIAPLTVDSATPPGIVTPVAPVSRVTPVAPVSLAAVRALVRGLNREQRQAVLHGPGPLLVLAGPGTGKTEVVTRRVARLIAAKLALPRQILALTFTDNAAREMQARVDLLVPYGQADAEIHTFHAFGDRLLREHAFELGLAGDVRLINRAEAIVLLRENVFELGLARYLPLGDPTRFLGALVDAFGRAKDERITPQALQVHADALLEQVAAGSETVDQALADVAAARAELARAYGFYGDLLTRRGLIDHADQIGLPLRLLFERPAIRDDVQRRFRFLLVDELQDANAAQVELVLALAGPGGNVMVVGDPDQGIYDFRGASSRNVARFATAYPGLREVVLRRNYRSRPPIIEASRRLIAHNDHAGDGPSEQVPHRRRRREQPVRVRVYARADEEADAIAAEIASRVAKGARPKEFAVLVRSNAETGGLVRSLRVRGIPASNGSRPDLLRLPAVRSLLAFLRVVADPANSLELYALATAQPYLLSADLLNPLLQVGRRRSRPLFETLVDSLNEGGPIDAGPRRRLSQLVEHLRAGIEMSAGHSTGEVLHDYLRRSGMLSRLARISNDGPDLAGLRGVARFVGLIRSRAGLLAYDRVSFLVPHLERLGNEETALEADGPDPDEVCVLTVHRAKGLEFKVVFLAGLVDGRFPVHSRAQVLDLPIELTGRDATKAGLAEERRLFYVAMTRARDELWLSYHGGGRARRRPSPFIAEALDALPLAPVDVLALPHRSDVDFIEAQLKPEPVPELPPTPAGGPLSLSFSQVDEYLGCPERYRLRYVVGLSTPAHHALAYGSALHQTIAAFHASQGRGAPMTEQALLDEFARHWTPDGFLSREHEEARYSAGRESLKRFRRRELESGRVPIAIERPFRFRLGQDQIVGRIDRLDAGPAGVVITDYKASDVSDQKRADTRTRDSLQLQVYALAHQAETGEIPERVQLHFIDTGVVGVATPDGQRLERARQTLMEAASGIRGQQFAARPSPLGCGRCPFREICPQSAA